MADKKISALTGATTPLAGTEVLPIVQSGATVKVAVSDLTAGRAVTALSVVTTEKVAFGGATNANSIVNIGSANPLSGTTQNMARIVAAGTSAGTGNLRGYQVQLSTTAASYTLSSLSGVYIQAPVLGAGSTITRAVGLDVQQHLVGTNNANISDNETFIGNWFINQSSTDASTFGGNIALGTAAKGINFTANTPAAGMSSQLLNWYEEGTWTPTQGAGLVVVGAFSSSGTYTRVGRQVTVQGALIGATSIASLAGNVITAGLPFTPASTSNGAASNAFAGSASVCLLSGNDIYSISAIANGGGVIYFTMTYFV